MQCGWCLICHRVNQKLWHRVINWEQRKHPPIHICTLHTTCHTYAIVALVLSFSLLFRGYFNWSQSAHLLTACHHRRPMVCPIYLGCRDCFAPSNVAMTTYCSAWYAMRLMLDLSRRESVLLIYEAGPSKEGTLDD